MGALALLLGNLPAIIQTVSAANDLYVAHSGDDDWLTKNLPLILATVGTGAELLTSLHGLASRGTVTDAELAEFAAKMEAALAESQAALR